MAEYAAHPLWDRSPGGFGDIEPGELGASRELQCRLNAWNDAYERRLNGPVDQPEADAWQREGVHLAEELQRELGPAVEVLYHDPRTGSPRRVG